MTWRGIRANDYRMPRCVPSVSRDSPRYRNRKMPRSRNTNRTELMNMAIRNCGDEAIITIDL